MITKFTMSIKKTNRNSIFQNEKEAVQRMIMFSLINSPRQNRCKNEHSWISMIFYSKQE